MMKCKEKYIRYQNNFKFISQKGGYITTAKKVAQNTFR